MEKQGRHLSPRAKLMAPRREQAKTPRRPFALSSVSMNCCCKRISARRASDEPSSRRSLGCRGPYSDGTLERLAHLGLLDPAARAASECQIHDRRALEAIELRGVLEGARGATGPNAYRP